MSTIELEAVWARAKVVVGWRRGGGEVEERWWWTNESEIQRLMELMLNSNSAPLYR
jgi:hypothetical protein